MHKNWYKKRQQKYNMVEFSSKVLPVLSLYQSACNVRIVTIVYVLGGWWRWALLSPDGVAPSRMVGVSASVNLPLHHKVQKFYSGTDSSRWSRKKGRKTVVVVVVVVVCMYLHAVCTLGKTCTRNWRTCYIMRRPNVLQAFITRYRWR